MSQEEVLQKILEILKNDTSSGKAGIHDKGKGTIMSENVIVGYPKGIISEGENGFLYRNYVSRYPSEDQKILTELILELRKPLPNKSTLAKICTWLKDWGGIGLTLFQIVQPYLNSL